MKLLLSTEERETCRKALARLKRVTEAAQKSYTKASLSSIAADGQLGCIDTATRAIDTTKEMDDVELTNPRRLAVLAGLGLLMEDVDQTKSREQGLLIPIEGSEARLDDLKQLARRLGDQSEMELPDGRIPTPADGALVGSRG